MTQKNSLFILSSYLIYGLVMPLLSRISNPTIAFTTQTFFNILSLGLFILINYKIAYQNSQETSVISFNRLFLGSILAFVSLLIAQIIFKWIEFHFFHLSGFSENTNLLLEISRKYPFYIIGIIFTAPVLEELVFRKVLFGNMSDFISPNLAATFSSLLFSFAHHDGHFIIYFVLGLILCFTYHKTQSILAPIFAHIGMNIVILAFSL